MSIQLFSFVGFTVGNALEIQEAVECLGGRGPDDLRELVTALGECVLLCLSGG